MQYQSYMLVNARQFTDRLEKRCEAREICFYRKTQRISWNLKRKWDKKDTYRESERAEIPGAHNKESGLGGF